MKAITFIIPNRGGEHVPEVIENFKKTFQEYVDNIEFIVVEQCDNNPFLRGQLFNIGYNFSNTEYLGLIDNDIYNLDSFDIIKKYNELSGPYLAFDEITQIKLNDSKVGYSILSSEKRLSGFGAFQVMTYSDFNEANGFSNLCFGWGAEDNIFNLRLNLKRMKHKLGHINHKKRINLNKTATENNKRILELQKNNTISKIYDGYKQTTYDIEYDKKEDGVRYIGVKNISVCKDYKYMDVYNKATSIAKIVMNEVKEQEEPIANEEKIIITLTTWKKRIGNIPEVLKTILNQTKKPDKIVINLSSQEFANKESDIPDSVKKFLSEHEDLISINWVDGPNTKQWKKIIPTLKLYPEDCVICIDDDFIYPKDFIDTMWNAHLKHPNNPISGNMVKFHGFQCHCGCASLVKLDYLKDIFEVASDDVMKYHSSDIFYSYVAARAGTPYIYCGKLFFTNMKNYRQVDALGRQKTAKGALSAMWDYLEKKYGKISGGNSSVTYPTSSHQSTPFSTFQGSPIDNPWIKMRKANSDMARRVVAARKFREKHHTFSIGF